MRGLRFVLASDDGEAIKGSAAPAPSAANEWSRIGVVDGWDGIWVDESPLNDLLCPWNLLSVKSAVKSGLFSNWSCCCCCAWCWLLLNTDHPQKNIKQSMCSPPLSLAVLFQSTFYCSTWWSPCPLTAGLLHRLSLHTLTNTHREPRYNLVSNLLITRPQLERHARPTLEIRLLLPYHQPPLHGHSSSDLCKGG